MSETFLPPSPVPALLCAAVSLLSGVSRAPSATPYDAFSGRLDDDALVSDAAAVFEAGFRDRGNDAYMAALAHLRDRLLEGGFEEGGLDALQYLELGEKRQPWNGRSARLDLVLGDGSREPLVGFEGPHDPDRTCLCRNSYPTRDGGEVLDLVVDPADADDVRGRVVLAPGGVGALFRRFVGGRGARGVLAFDTPDYNRPDRDPGVIRFGAIPRDPSRSAFGMMLSPEAAERIRAVQKEEGAPKVFVRIESDFGDPVGAPAIVAAIAGSDPSLPPLWITAHLDEPGANDNASGCATAVGAALAYRKAIADGAIARPRRGVVFVIGQEIEGPRLLLEARRGAKGANGPPAFGISLDMTGEDPDSNGAPFLVERLPDPSAVRLRPPDRHTEWGGGRYDERRVRGHALCAVVRRARLEVAARNPGWTHADHPFEGGSDHQPLLDAGIPALLLWHFTDPAYHTNRDAMDQVSGAEMARSALVALLAAHALCSGDAESARWALDAVLDQAEERFAFELRNARRDPSDPDAAWAADAYETWFGQAARSCAELWPERNAAFDRAIEDARARIGARADAVRAALRDR